MESRRKVTLIGAGSASFGPATASGFLFHPNAPLLELVLHDVNPEAMRPLYNLCRKVVAGGGSSALVSFCPDRAEALAGADVVVVSIAVEREAQWEADRELGLRFGIDHYAENGGPGAIFHTARNLKQLRPILRDMERLCPDAWLLNFTNPVPRISRAISKYTSLSFVGVCHQLWFGYFMVGILLGKELGIPLPGSYHFRWDDKSQPMHHEVIKGTMEKVHIEAAGVNHFTWARSIKRRDTGEDLLPLLLRANETFDGTFEPLTRELLALTGAFPVAGDCHIAEYLPFTHNVQRGTFAHYDIQMYDFAWAAANRRQQRIWLEELASAENWEPLRHLHSERAEVLAWALLGQGDYFDEALNIPNHGAVENLPPEAIVEVPCRVGATGVTADGVWALPEPAAEWSRRQAVIADLSVEGIWEGREESLLRAWLLDPMVDDPRLPRRFLEAYKGAGLLDIEG